MSVWFRFSVYGLDVIMVYSTTVYSVLIISSMYVSVSNLIIVSKPFRFATASRVT